MLLLVLVLVLVLVLLVLLWLLEEDVEDVKESVVANGNVGGGAVAYVAA